MQDVYVNPGFGFYTFLGATVSSLILTHIILHYERATTAPQPTWRSPKLALRNYLAPERSSGAPLQPAACITLAAMLVGFR